MWESRAPASSSELRSGVASIGARLRLRLQGGVKVNFIGRISRRISTLVGSTHQRNTSTASWPAPTVVLKSFPKHKHVCAQTDARTHPHAAFPGLLHAVSSCICMKSVVSDQSRDTF